MVMVTWLLVGSLTFTPVDKLIKPTLFLPTFAGSQGGVKQVEQQGDKQANAEPAPVAQEQQPEPKQMLWAHTVPITEVKAHQVQPLPLPLKRVLAARKLIYAGYLDPEDALGRVANMSTLTDEGKKLYALLSDPTARALLATIRYAEGTGHADGYRVVFGGAKEKSFTLVHTGRVRNGSSAEGAYQFMNYTAPGTARAVGVGDGMPLSQDIMALYRIRNRLKYAGVDTDAPFKELIHALAPEWASFPCGPSGRFGPDKSCYSFKGKPQPTMPMSALREAYEAALEGKHAPLGYDFVVWDLTLETAMKGFQFAYQVEAHGDFDEDTVLALFDGVMGDVLTQPNPFEKPSFKPVSVHSIEVVQRGETVGGYAVSSGYGPRSAPCAGCSAFHPAWDIATPPNTPVYAPFEGLDVVKFFDPKGGGNVLRFVHNGVQYSLLHMAEVFQGKHSKGAIIGRTGATGLGTGPHLDVRARMGGAYVLPSKEVVFFMLDPTAFHL